MKRTGAILGGAVTAAALIGLARTAFLVVNVEGDSMTPTYRSGDAVLAVRRWIAGAIYEGDVVVCRLPEELQGPARYLVKRVTLMASGEVYVQGDGERSFDSRAFGSIPERCVIGRVVARLTLARGAGQARGQRARQPSQSTA